MPSRLTGFVCPTVSMVTTGHATSVEKTLLAHRWMVYRLRGSRHSPSRAPLVREVLINRIHLKKPLLFSIKTLYLDIHGIHAIIKGDTGTLFKSITSN